MLPISSERRRKKLGGSSGLRTTTDERLKPVQARVLFGHNHNHIRNLSFSSIEGLDEPGPRTIDRVWVGTPEKPLTIRSQNLYLGPP